MLDFILCYILFTAIVLVVIKRTKKKKPDPSNLRICFVHPDLGIGGAERLVVDAGLAYKDLGHEVVFYTSHHNPRHSFAETNNGTFKVHVRGDWLPRNIFGRFFAFFAYLRSCYLALTLLFSQDFDLYFCDQISISIPILKITGTKILFYCHFPDQLLTQRRSFLKKIYRAPLDYFEEKTTGAADLILVNSKFTRSIFEKTFASLVSGNSDRSPSVLYPSINVSSFELSPEEDVLDDVLPKTAEVFFLSINRYEVKKNVELCIHAMGLMKKELSQQEWKKIHLVVAGGFDPKSQENKENYDHLKALVESNDMDDHVTFLRSVSHDVKCALLSRCRCLLYTPDKEHFGIVPIEAMYLKKMVVARNSGGPLESIDPEKTGCLCDENPQSWARALIDYGLDENKAQSMGLAGHKRFKDLFSFQKFTKDLGLYTLSMFDFDIVSTEEKPKDKAKTNNDHKKGKKIK